MDPSPGSHRPRRRGRAEAHAPPTRRARGRGGAQARRSPPLPTTRQPLKILSPVYVWGVLIVLVVLLIIGFVGF
jgi:hypothetical protein